MERIALDIRTIQDHFPGIGRYTYNLALALAHEAPNITWLLLFDSAQRNAWFNLNVFRGQPNVELIDCGIPNFSPREQWQLPNWLRRSKAQIYHSPYYIMPYRPPCPAIVTVHDLIPILYPHYFAAPQRLAFGVTIRMALRTAKRIVADSKATARDLERLLRVSRNRISVVCAAADPALKPASADERMLLRSKCTLPDNFALYLGSNKPHKNLRILIEALAAAPPDQRFNLVIAGHWDQRLNEPKILAETIGVDRHVTWLGPVAQNDLSALYSAASVFVFPSEYEGFGLPVLEAMACGTPVICSNASSLPEVAGDAAVMLPPGDLDAWAASIRALLNDAGMRNHLRSAGLRRAASFSWAAAARQMLEVYAAV